MGRKRKNRKERPPSTEEQLTEAVSKLLGASTITPSMVYDFILLGHRCYKFGSGLPQEVVWKAIINGFSDHERYYLTPGQHAFLHGREDPEEEDFRQLAV